MRTGLRFARGSRSVLGSEKRRLRFEPLEDRRVLAIIVDTLVDENDGVGVGDISLRDAIAAAEEGERIEFAVNGTIELQHGELLIDKTLTISGPGADLLSIDAGGASRVFRVDDGNASTFAEVTIADLTITGGVAGAGDGGGILNRETLTIFSCTIRGNSADDGGGIGSFLGTISVYDSTISDNTASGTSGGGAGIFSFSELVGALSVISNSTISNNETTDPNTIGGGVYNFLGTLYVEFSTITENEAAAGKGSGIASLGDTNAAITEVYSTIVAGNVNSDVDHVVGTTTSFQSIGYNLIGFGNSTGPFAASGDQRFVADPMLGPLADNGGPTWTHAVLSGSPALDAGDPDLEVGVDTPTEDQRGPFFARIVDGNNDAVARIDIGAFELATTYVVDTLADENDGIGVGFGTSLRDAIEAANLANSGVPLIVFDPALTAGGHVGIELSLGQLEITGSMSIAGPGSGLLTIDAQNNSRVMNVDDGIDDNYLNVSLSGLTITGGNATFGGGIYSHETLQVADSVITGNSAEQGGGICNGYYGYLTLLRSEVSGNTATTSGGGIYNYDGIASLSESTITGNNAPDGAGIHNSYYGYLSLANSSVSGNIGTQVGGGVLNEGYAVVQDSSISGNVAADGGGIFNDANSYLAIERSTISGNTATGAGGGMHNLSASVEVFDSTISGNTATYGGGLYVAGDIYYSTTINNSTISGNTATVAGGGVYNFQGTAYIEHSTITNNTAPAGMGGGLGVWADPNTALLYVLSTIVSGNLGNDLFVADEDFNSFISEGYNLIGIGDGDGAFVEPGDQIGVTDPKLGALLDNGGPTLTHALLAGSPAIDGGDPLAVVNEGSVPEFDQRTTGFGRIVGMAIDIGAYEAQAPTPALVGDYNSDGFVNAADFVVWRDTLGSTTNLAANGDDSNDVIDAVDYEVWVENFGAPLGVGSAARGASASIAGGSQPPASSALDAAFALFDDSRPDDTTKRTAVLSGAASARDDDALLLLATSIAESGREGEDDAAVFDYDREVSSDEEESLSEPALFAGLIDAWP